MTEMQAAGRDLRADGSALGRAVAFLYGVASYAVFFASFLYAVGFVEGLVVPKAIDDGASVPAMQAIAVDLLLLALFALQHSAMARPRFKQWWTQFVPKPVERSTYVLLASLALALLCWQWRPLPAVVWHIDKSGPSRWRWSACRSWAG